MAKLHGMMINKLMQMQAAGQHTDTEATSMPAVVAQTQKEGLERTAPSIQAKLTVSTPGDKYESKKKNKKLFRPKKFLFLGQKNHSKYHSPTKKVASKHRKQQLKP